MVCPKCRSTDITVQIVQEESKTTIKRVGLFRKLIRLCLVICTCGLWILVPRGKDKSTTTYVNRKVFTCQNCGTAWYQN